MSDGMNESGGSVESEQRAEAGGREGAARNGEKDLRKLKPGDLRRRCARFVLDHAEAIGAGEPEIPVELNDRAGDIWEPLLVLADLAGGRWPDLARQAAMGVAGGAEENNPIGALLLDIYLIFINRNAERLFSRKLVESLNYQRDPPWVELRKGKELTELSLAKLLRGYGVRPRTIWVGECSAKGYVKDDFTEVFGRYITKWQAKALLEEVVAAAKPPKPEGQ
jgi:hypothetical protein